MRYCTILALIFAMPLFASVDQEWQNSYNEAMKSAALKEYVVAEAMYAKALHNAEIFGKDDQRVATTVQSRALMFRKEKKLPEAEDDARRALAIFAVNPGEKSLEFGQTHLILAGILMDEAKYQDAMSSLRVALPLLEQNLGPGDSTVVDGTCMLGTAYVQLKRYASAETPLRRCADLRVEDGGVGTAEFGEAANGLAIVFQHLGNLTEADRYFNYAEKIREQSLGISSPQLADTLEAHAALLRQLNREADAKLKERMAASIRALSRKK